MSICIHDLTNKIIKDAPNSHSFFNALFEYLITLKMPYIYDYNNLSNLNNKKSRQYLEKKLYGFLVKNGFSENGKEYKILDAICHCFINFKEDGIVRMYKNRLPEFWYPKIIVSQFIGIKEHIDELDNKVSIFRGTSQEEYNSGIFGQSWSLSKTVAKRFAFSTYENTDHYKKTVRVVLSTTINKNLIYFYDKDRKEHNGEEEVIINTKHLSKEIVEIEENNLKMMRII